MKVNINFGLNSNTVEFNDHRETVREGSTTFLNFWEKPEGRDQISFELVIALQFPAKHGNSVKFRDEVVKVREDASMRYNTKNVTVLRLLPCRSQNSVTVLSYWPGGANEIKLSESNTFELLLPFGDRWRTEMKLAFKFSFDTLNLDSVSKLADLCRANGMKPIDPKTKINIYDEEANQKLSNMLWETAHNELLKVAYFPRDSVRSKFFSQDMAPPSTTAPRKCCGNCEHAGTVLPFTSDPSGTAYCKARQVNVPRTWYNSECWREGEKKETEETNKGDKQTKELTPEEFVNCILNHQLKAAIELAKYYPDVDGGHDPEEIQDEINADLAEQNQQLQRRVDELEKCLAAQEEQISDYAKELGPLRERDREARRILKVKYATTNSQFRSVKV